MKTFEERNPYSVSVNKLNVLMPQESAIVETLGIDLGEPQYYYVVDKPIAHSNAHSYFVTPEGLPKNNTLKYYHKVWCISELLKHLPKKITINIHFDNELSVVTETYSLVLKYEDDFYKLSYQHTDNNGGESILYIASSRQLKETFIRMLNWLYENNIKLQ